MPDVAVPNVLRRLRESHEERVLAVLRTHGAQSRGELGRRTGLSRATLYAIIQRLVASDTVVETSARQDGARGRGRPATLVTLNPGAGLALGLDLGRRRVHAAIANVAHEVIASDSDSCAESASWSTRMDVALRLVDGMAARSEVSLNALTGVGAGLVGPVHHAGRPGHRRTNRIEQVRDELANRFDAPVHVDNNTRLAALAEAIWGSAAGVQNVLYIRVSYGVGGGLVLDGQLFAGAAGGAGELGHVCVEPDGPACTCGGHGCLERYVCLPAILEQCHARRFEHVLGRLRRDDSAVRSVIATAGLRLGRVIAGACNVINPEAVVIGGEVALAGDALLSPARKAIDAYAHRDVRRSLRVHAATLGEAGAARGGIALALHRSTLLADYPT